MHMITMSRRLLIGLTGASVMIATVAPGGASAEHTINTLRYAQHVRSFAAAAAAAAAASSGRSCLGHGRVGYAPPVRVALSAVGAGGRAPLDALRGALELEG